MRRVSKDGEWFYYQNKNKEWMETWNNDWFIGFITAYRSFVVYIKSNYGFGVSELIVFFVDFSR